MKEKDFIYEVEKTTLLAKLNLTEEKKFQFAKEIKEVLNYFQDINDLNPEEVEDVNHYSILEKNQTREDEKRDFSSIGKEQIKKAFPQREGEYLKVKAVL